MRAFVHLSLSVAAAIALTAARPLDAQDKASKDRNKLDKKPALSLRASPAVSFSPAKIVLRADVRGGPNDYEEFYCPSIEWDWGDGTRSEATYDCDPYEPGKSEIKRLYTMEHIFQLSGSYRVQFSLKRGDKTLAATNTSVQVRPGLREGIPGPQ